MASNGELWTEREGLDFEVANGVLSDEIGRRNVALRALAHGDDSGRARLRMERSAIVDLKANLDIHDHVRIFAILARDLDAAFLGIGVPGCTGRDMPMTHDEATTGGTRP